jgi:hypothetical protein
LRHHLRETENTIIALNRQLTEAIVWKRPTGNLSTELDETVKARDFLKSRLQRLDG